MKYTDCGLGRFHALTAIVVFLTSLATAAEPARAKEVAASQLYELAVSTDTVTKGLPWPLTASQPTKLTKAPSLLLQVLESLDAKT